MREREERGERERKEMVVVGGVGHAHRPRPLRRRLLSSSRRRGEAKSIKFYSAIKVSGYKSINVHACTYPKKLIYAIHLRAMIIVGTNLADFANSAFSRYSFYFQH